MIFVRLFDVLIDVKYSKLRNFTEDYNATRVYIKGSKNWYTGKVIAYKGYFYFALDAADNFLERELGMKRGVSGRGGE